jgi:MFS superfamily sulfate permease-like transporter
VEPLGRYVNVRLHPRARITPEVLVYRLDDRLFSANASYVRGRIHALKELISSLRDKGEHVGGRAARGPDAGNLPDVGLLDMIGEGHVYPTMRAAVQALGPERDGA